MAETRSTARTGGSRQRASHSLEAVVGEAVALLDEDGEAALTFRALYGGWVRGVELAPPGVREPVLGLVASLWGLGKTRNSGLGCRHQKERGLHGPGPWGALSTPAEVMGSRVMLCMTSSFPY